MKKHHFHMKNPHFHMKNRSGAPLNRFLARFYYKKASEAGSNEALAMFVAFL
jgi:hypothetical protein